MTGLIGRREVLGGIAAAGAVTNMRSDLIGPAHAATVPELRAPPSTTPVERGRSVTQGRSGAFPEDGTAVASAWRAPNPTTMAMITSTTPMTAAIAPRLW